VPRKKKRNIEKIETKNPTGKKFFSVLLGAILVFLGDPFLFLE